MKIVDSKGRLLGKISLLDLGAACVILLVVIGIFFFPGTSGTSIGPTVAQTKPVEVDVLVRGLSVSDPTALFRQFEAEKTASIIIRNQPAGQIDIVSYKNLEQTVAVPQPDGSVKALPDPRPEISLSTDMILTLQGKGQITSTGAVLGSQKVKVGTLVELDGSDYNFRGSIIDVRVGA